MFRFWCMNFKEKLAQNAGNRISEVLDFKISRGSIPSDPTTSVRFSASVNKTLDPPLILIVSWLHTLDSSIILWTRPVYLLVLVYGKNLDMNFSLHWQDILSGTYWPAYIEGSLPWKTCKVFVIYTRASKTCQGKSDEETLFICTVYARYTYNTLNHTWPGWDLRNGQRQYWDRIIIYLLTG
jgi:hypothetical protein